RDALLVAIEVDEIGRLAAVERRAPVARDLAVDRLDLDDLRAVIAEHRGREWAGERVREIEHDDVLERGRGVMPPRCRVAAPRLRHESRSVCRKRKTLLQWRDA